MTVVPRRRWLGGGGASATGAHCDSDSSAVVSESGAASWQQCTASGDWDMRHRYGEGSLVHIASGEFGHRVIYCSTLLPVRRNFWVG